MDNIRSFFDIEPGISYLNSASIGLMPIQVRDKLNELNINFSRKGEAALNKDPEFNDWKTLQQNVAALILGSPDSIVFSTNTASALHIVADGLYSRYKPGLNIVITDVEFSTNSYMWQKVVERYGMELRTVPYSRGENGIDSWEKFIDDNTVLVSLSSVQFSDGFRSNVREIADLTHQHGGLIAIDAIQQIGGMPFDVSSMDVDFVAAGAYKWQLGPFGTGFCHIREELIEDLDSILVGWFSAEKVFNMSHNQFKPGVGARRYQQSLLPILTAYNESIRFLLQQNMYSVHSHVLSILDHLIDNLPESCQLSSNLNSESRSNIVRFDIENAEKHVNNLAKEGVIVSYREGGIRVSPHMYSTKDDINRLLEYLN